MAGEQNLETGGQVLVDCLKIHGVDMAFCVPGESYLPVLDALYDAKQIRLISCRQEGGAAMMAEAYGKLTGRPGICFVTRGPGATNASAGVHVAFQDSTPMILFIGQVARPTVEREAFQEIDFRRMFGQMSKWVAQIDDAARIPEFLSHAFHLAVSGRPGPVVLALPEDMLTDRVEAPPTGPYQRLQAHPGAEDIKRMRAMLTGAKRPLMILGEGGWDAHACDDIRVFAEANNLPTAASFRCQDHFDNSHRNYIGDVGIAVNPKLAERIKKTDLLIAVGARLGEMTTSDYTLVEVPRPRQTLIHVHSGPEELGRVYQADLPINASVTNFATAARAMQPVDSGVWSEWAAEARSDYLAWIDPTRTPGQLQIGEVMAWLRNELPANAIITNGAGNYTVWVHRFYQYRRYRTQLAPVSGSMGYGLPAAVAAKLLHPERIVVCFAGDGCFQMTMQEFGTAVQYGANIIVLVLNNNSFGTIRMHQERRFPGRVSGTDLVNPDFAALAKAYGAHAELIRCTGEFSAAFLRALEAGRPALLELRIDLEALTPRASLSEIRQAALASLDS